MRDPLCLWMEPRNLLTKGVSFIMGDLLDTGYRPSAEEYRHGKHWRRSVMVHTFHLPPNELQSLDFSLRSILFDTELDSFIVPLILI